MASERILMPWVSRRVIVWVLVAMYVCMVAAGTGFSLLKLRSLSYHARDYGYYCEMCGRLADPRMTASLSLNPEGSNLLRYRGIEGVGRTPSLHRSIHFEPIKHLEALVLRWLHEPGLYAFVAALYFLPVLCCAGLAAASPRGRAVFYVLMAAAYCLLPSTMSAVSFDLRPYALLLPLFWVCAATVLESGPAWIALASFCLLLAAREEALVLGLGLVIIAFVMERRAPRAAQGRLRWWLLLAWVAGVCATLGYFRWTGYPSTLSLDLTRIWAKLTAGAVGVLPLATLAAGGVGAVAVWLRAPRQGRVIIVLGGLIALMSLSILGASLRQMLHEAAYGARYALLSGTALLAAIPLRHLLAGRRGERGLVPALAFVVCVSCLGSFAPVPDSPMSQARAFAAKAADSAPLFVLRGQVSRYDTVVVCDESAYQVLCALDAAYVYQRLPYWMLPGSQRNFPANAAVLSELLRTRADYVVARDRGISDLAPLLAGCGVKTEPLFCGGVFTILRIVRA